jgi:hypothetical protein
MTLPLVFDAPRLLQDVERMVREARLEELPEIGKSILKGQIKGRVVCKPGA